MCPIALVSCPMSARMVINDVEHLIRKAPAAARDGGWIAVYVAVPIGWGNEMRKRGQQSQTAEQNGANQRAGD